MKEYFKRLQSHPGTIVCSLLTPLFFLAAFGNENFTFDQGIIVGSVFSLTFWSIVLFNN